LIRLDTVVEEAFTIDFISVKRRGESVLSRTIKI
jgi:hypothetical protein